MSQPPRVVAVRVIERVVSGKENLDEAWARFAGQAKAEDRPLVQALIYGSLRWLTWLEAQVSALTKRDDWRRDSILRSLLVLGAWEAVGLSTPPHAAVSESVAAARTLKRARASGMVNAVLRRLRREPPHVPADEAARLAFPEWLLSELKQAWPENWRQIALASNEHPPMALRVNLDQLSRADYAGLLSSCGLTARSGQLVPSSLVLEQPCGVEALPGFVNGRVSVQDEAAQLAPYLLEPGCGERVLDACAAPGSKSVHILEYCPRAELTAVDRSARRLQQVRENLRRAGLEAHCIAADAADLGSWWDGEPFHRILLDAPCTASGVIRRHPDIKWLRGPDDVERMAQAQLHLLESLWPVLAPGGVLLYATCSVLKQENDAVIGRFVTEQADAESLSLARYSDYVQLSEHGLQLLPGNAANTDGFFYSLLRKEAL
ncbi:16S rRNA (cytosine(967)-C(5))-methyltransferase RsmB [Halorhodospira halochloris]|uniref:16S rRNA (cytosine(967)-C(5))-methyltransferase n=1 Tax=Halorhodospira halochloris TaxID=1052 RepID=A0A110B4H8_HALHR|nr:16S rRNA (cytosine(967)-C(5))-methyltransferase RsmB [Halorhodospira halochloris]MBK1650698.1 16S rRNA (cytosine(967)-C(5))-methyltransferase [Halorhodospira halochloris]MCG5529807.1 16S rRNA (cytosine(967)-C(5))-methyltransferase RsmB [Halorhodospira halochloris]MCG5548976.1 16S rRNA (cytosine(967)-C(5))-methyltransferase RsmB [Halorhodospira halochloris]BAU56813.1 ribosomal RNA small subunit methyltransferase B [Halorhodospira halochloris]